LLEYVYKNELRHFQETIMNGGAGAGDGHIFRDIHRLSHPFYSDRESLAEIIADALGEDDGKPIRSMEEILA
jgi:hypothetical protein